MLYDNVCRIKTDMGEGNPEEFTVVNIKQGDRITEGSSALMNGTWPQYIARMKHFELRINLRGARDCPENWDRHENWGLLVISLELCRSNRLQTLKLMVKRVDPNHLVTDRRFTDVSEFAWPLCRLFHPTKTSFDVFDVDRGEYVEKEVPWPRDDASGSMQYDDAILSGKIYFMRAESRLRCGSWIDSDELWIDSLCEALETAQLAVFESSWFVLVDVKIDQEIGQAFQELIQIVGRRRPESSGDRNLESTTRSDTYSSIAHEGTNIAHEEKRALDRLSNIAHGYAAESCQ